MDRTCVYCDGACSGNPGPGGWGAVVVRDGSRRELSGGFRKTTNNRMELWSVIAALDAVSPDAPVTVVSDSRYVVDMLNGGHAERWRRNGWMRDKRSRALNPDLWGRLLGLCDGRDVEFEWVRGHADDAENCRCDELAVAARSGNDLPEDDGYEHPVVPNPLGQPSLFDLM
ncbi:ribonuclease H [Verrucomicrobiota bacterium]